MITKFEEITAELTVSEKEQLPILIALLNEYTENLPITAPRLCEEMEQTTGKKLPQSRFRKMINLIRTNAIIPVIATSNGYFVCKDRAIIDSQIESMNERAKSIRDASQGLERWLHSNIIGTQIELF